MVLGTVEFLEVALYHDLVGPVATRVPGTNRLVPRAVPETSAPPLGHADDTRWRAFSRRVFSFCRFREG